MQALQQQQQAQATASVPVYQPPPVAVQQQPSELDITELETLLHKIMDSCTKDSISVSHSLSHYKCLYHAIENTGNQNTGKP